MAKYGNIFVGRTHQMTPGISRKSRNLLRNTILEMLELLDIVNFENYGKDARRQIPKIRLMNS